jgi:hypothetical protein
MIEIKTHHNSTYPKGGFSYSNDSFVVNQTLVFQIKFCGKSPALRVAAKRQAVKKPPFLIISQITHTPKRQYSRSNASCFLGSKL